MRKKSATITYLRLHVLVDLRTRSLLWLKVAFEYLRLHVTVDLRIGKRPQDRLLSDP